MSEVVDVASRFAERRAHTRAVERFNQETERLAAALEAGKCCATLETGNYPEHDFHLCLRTKDHKGYHMDKTTGLNWKWSDT